MEFHVDDKVQVIGQEFPVVFVIKQITAGPNGPLYAGDEPGWWREDQLDYFLTDDEKDLREKYERILHNTETCIQNAKEAGDVLGKKKHLPEWFRRWYFRELGRILGWDRDLDGR